MRLLLVEDDKLINQLLAEALSNQHYVVDVAADGHAGWDFVKSFDYDLVLIDVMLPKMDGISLCRQLRTQGYQMPVLMLTARDATEDRVNGLDAGADDYVIKPYKLQELSARIRALLRRGGSSLPPAMKSGNLSLDVNTREVTYKGCPLRLTPKEYRLLELFMRSGSKVLSRSAILENLWSFDEPPDEDAVKALVKRLRHKLKLAGSPGDPIETAYGVGYRLKQNP
ncbi:MAG: Response regulator MprA [Chroococcidiopsis sp. SAG 2025]|uniref:response regulator transcription factor n=1 Tax=Chroococcidiopsis sp. SAG 2025 TaxID=171389 RepID=UPI0029370FE6|nr:response regulator transcription factor [Chroococcidiopsis sp. SAG 2025]MDV2994085.1 Response regulator MprA [Chroococcidiopsis sp. SAG 2025]